MDSSEVENIFSKQGEAIISGQRAQAAALTVRELDPGLIEATLNQIQRELQEGLRLWMIWLL